MTSPSLGTSGIWDNHHRGSIGNFLKERIRQGSDLSFVSAYFTIYAYAALKDKLDQINHLRFLFGEPQFIQSLDSDKTEKKAFRIESDALALVNKLRQKRVARECADWLKAKAEIRSIIKPGFLHGKMYHMDNNGVQEAIVGSSNFTVHGLGLGVSGNNIELNLEVDSTRDRKDLKKWFDEVWHDTALAEDVKAEVLNYLSLLYQNHSPEFVYFKTLFHIFEDYLTEAERGGLLDEKTGFFESDVWDMLYEFQKDGVKGAINKILKHHGCIIADSVGLGKTFEALAVIKYFELLNGRVLVLCPKKLEDNWKVYRENDTRNPLLKDRFAFTVLAHTDLGRYYLLYIRNDNTVRFTFTQVKNILSMFQKLSVGRAAPYQKLCDLFDQETESGAKMDKYSALLVKAINAIVRTFQKRTAAGLQSGRAFVIPDKQEQATDASDFELITWLVIKSGGTDG